MDIQYENWKVVKELGTGSFGSVYEIEREEFGVYKAALKVISIPQHAGEINAIRSSGMSDKSISDYYSSMVEEIVREVALMSKLKGNTNIVSYEDHKVIPHKDDIGWDIYIRMELLTPLDVYVQNHELSEQEIARLGIGICQALERCQKLNIIHRDIKPGNIFVSEQGDFKLGDFGIARTIERTMSNMSRKGTVNYMAPEVYNGMDYGLTVDIYSLGLVMYWLLNHNRTPFLPPYPEPIRFQDSEMALFKRINGTPLPNPNNTPSPLGDVILKACAFDPQDRYQSPSSFRHALERVVEHTWEMSATLTTPAPLPAKKQEPVTEAAVKPIVQEKTMDSDAVLPKQTPGKEQTPELPEKKEVSEKEPSKTIGKNAPETAAKAKPPANGHNRKKLIGIIAAAVIVVVILLLILLPKKDTPQEAVVAETDTTAEAATSAPETTTETLIELEDYAGKEIASVSAELEEKGLKVNVEEVDGVEAEGTILEQSDAAGTSVEEGKTITLTISRGNKVAIPAFNNKSLKNVKAALEDLKIAGYGLLYDENVTPGRVVSVVLVTDEQAKTATTDAAGNTETAETPEETTTETTVSEQPLKEGDLVDKGATVKIYRGGIKLPEGIVGMAEADARTALTELSFVVAEENAASYDYVEGINYGQVMAVLTDDENSSALSADDVLKKGTAVKLQVNYYTAPVYEEPVYEDPVYVAPEPETEYYDF